MPASLPLTLKVPVTGRITKKPLRFDAESARRDGHLTVKLPTMPWRA
jgi:hypothetical protein